MLSMESVSPRRTKVLLALALVAAVYWLAMFVGTHVPLSRPPANDPYSLDKLLHAAAFAGLAFLVTAVGWACGFRSWKLYASVFVILAVYGIFDEASQAFVRRREADPIDWLADLAGTLLGVTAFVLGRQLWTDTPARQP
jgi:VanZ family protein